MNVLLGMFAFVVERAPKQLWAGCALAVVWLVWLVWFVRGLLK